MKRTSDNPLINIRIYMVPLLAVMGLVFIRLQYGVLFFHTLAELFSVIVGILMLVVSWNTRHFTHNDFLLYLGIGYFWIAILDAWHTFTVGGMPFIEVHGAEETLHFWIYTRLLEAVLLLSAIRFLKKKLNTNLALSVLAGISFLIMWASLKLEEPVMLTSQGLSDFKVNTEYLIICLLGISIYLYIRFRELLAPRVLYFLITSIVLTIFAELSFTLYTDFLGMPFTVGHIFKFISFWMIYEAIVHTTLTEPFSMMSQVSGSYDAIPHPTLLVDSECRISQVNHAAKIHSRKTSDQLIHQPVHKFFHSAHVSDGECDLCEAIRKGKSIDNYLMTLDDNKWFLVSLAPVRLRGTTTGGMVQTITDISGRVRAEEALRSSETKLRTLIDSLPDLVWLKDPDGVYLACNAKFEDFFGSKESDIVGKTDYDFVDKELADFFREKDKAAIGAAKSSVNEEEVIFASDGHREILETIKTPMYASDGGLVGVLGVGRDITRRKILEEDMALSQRELEEDIAERVKAQEELNLLQKYTQNIIDSMPSMLIGVDQDCHVKHWNREAESLTGIVAEDAVGHDLLKVLPMLSDKMNSITEAINDQQPKLLPRHAYRTGDEDHYSNITIYPLGGGYAKGAVIRIDDISDRVRMEEMMMQTEKMMSVGGLAAGMAHEINNPLGGIMQGLQNIRRRLSPDLEANIAKATELNLDLNNLQAYLEQRQVIYFMNEMADAGKRASDIVVNMLQFSRKPQIGMAAEDMNALVDKTIALAAVDYDLRKKYDFRQIEIIRDFDNTLPPVRCFASEMQQVLLNLMRNSAQAFASQLERPNQPQIHLRTWQSDGQFHLEIRDNGPGMDRDTQRRVFEPFFTTKPPGLGTGLGLSVSYFIVREEHGGDISVTSQPGHGAKFVINLPLNASREMTS